MKKLLIGLIVLGSITAHAKTNSEYIFMNYNTFSDHGGITDRFFKIKVPHKNDYEITCDFKVEYLKDGQTKTSNTVHTVDIVTTEEMKVIDIAIDKYSDERGEASFINTIDIRLTVSELLAVLSSGDGYVNTGIVAGSFRNVKAITEMANDTLNEEEDFKSEITKAFDLTNKKYSAVIEAEGTKYETTLKVDCKESTLEQ